MFCCFHVVWTSECDIPISVRAFTSSERKEVRSSEAGHAAVRLSHPTSTTLQLFSDLYFLSRFRTMWRGPILRGGLCNTTPEERFGCKELIQTVCARLKHNQVNKEQAEQQSIVICRNEFGHDYRRL